MALPVLQDSIRTCKGILSSPGQELEMSGLMQGQARGFCSGQGDMAWADEEDRSRASAVIDLRSKWAISPIWFL